MARPHAAFYPNQTCYKPLISIYAWLRGERMRLELGCWAKNWRCCRRAAPGHTRPLLKQLVRKKRKEEGRGGDKTRRRRSRREAAHAPVGHGTGNEEVAGSIRRPGKWSVFVCCLLVWMKLSGTHYMRARTRCWIARRAGAQREMGRATAPRRLVFRVRHKRAAL